MTWWTPRKVVVLVLYRTVSCLSPLGCLINNISHLHQISLSPNTPISTILLKTHSDLMNEAQKNLMYSFCFFCYFFFYIIQKKQLREWQSSTSSTLAGCSGLDFTGTAAVGLVEVEASGELANCTGFWNADSATGLQEGRELSARVSLQDEVPTTPDWVRRLASALRSLQSNISHTEPMCFGTCKCEKKTGTIL